MSTPQPRKPGAPPPNATRKSAALAVAWVMFTLMIGALASHWPWD